MRISSAKGAGVTASGAQVEQAVVEDLRKMEADEKIREAGLILIVFNESEAVLEKDLQLFEDVLAQKQVLAGFRQVRHGPQFRTQRTSPLYRRRVADDSTVCRGRADVAVAELPLGTG